MNVGRQRSAEGQAVGARLLLGDSPLPIATVLCRRQIPDQRRPLDPGLDFDDARGRIESEYAVEPAHVEEDGARAKLLGPHPVPTAAYPDRRAAPPFRRRRL